MSAVTYPRFLVTYRDRKGQERDALMRIRSDVTDRAADAKRQLLGNLMSVAEVLRVEEHPVRRRS